MAGFWIIVDSNNQNSIKDHICSDKWLYNTPIAAEAETLLHFIKSVVEKTK